MAVKVIVNLVGGEFEPFIPLKKEFSGPDCFGRGISAIYRDFYGKNSPKRLLERGGGKDGVPHILYNLLVIDTTELNQSNQILTLQFIQG